MGEGGGPRERGRHRRPPPLSSVPNPFPTLLLPLIFPPSGSPATASPPSRPPPPHPQVTVPQHSYKLQLHAEPRHVGEVDWRHYRASVLRALPHAWRHPADTHMHTAHFARRPPRDFDAEKRRADALHAREASAQPSI